MSFCPFFSAWSAYFNTSCMAGLVAMNFLSFNCLGKPLFLLYIWRTTLPEGILGWQFLSFNILNILFHSLLTCRVFAEKSTHSLIGIPWSVTVFFPLAVIKILSLSLTFSSFYKMRLGVFFFFFALSSKVFYKLHGIISISFPDLGSSQLLLI